jgi:serine/threonine protein kinase
LEIGVHSLSVTLRPFKSGSGSEQGGDEGGPTTSGSPPQPDPERAKVTVPARPGTPLGVSGPVASGSIFTPLERGATVGRYMILNRVGEGGMGVVYAAYDPELERTVAIKLLRAVDNKFGSAEEQQARLLREAQAMAKISHTNVISVFDVGTFADGVFVAMEFVDGQTLRTWVKEKERPWKEVLDAFLKAGRGLAAAHAVGLAHRDFKPENVLIGKDGRVRVTDFGLARMVSDAPADLLSSSLSPKDGRASSDRHDPAITQAGVVMGTPKYMAPEQHAGVPADARSDQFSFCAALYWGLFRKRPFDHRLLAATSGQLSERARKQRKPGPTRAITGPGKDGTSRPVPVAVGLIKEPPRTPAVPGSIRRALMRGLSVLPEDRFGSMDELLAALDYEPQVQRRRWYAVAAACAVAVAGLLSYRQYLRARELTCSGAEQKLAGVWDAPIKEGMARAFRASGKPFAADVVGRVVQVIDRYTADWVSMHADACQATRVRGEQTEHVLSLRMICLDRRLKEVKALTGLLATADEKTVEKALDAAQTLQGLRQCADVEALATQVSLPEDPAARAEIERIGTMLAEVKALHDAGKYKSALEKAEQALPRAKSVRFRPIEAEALFWFGWLQVVTTGGAKEGERSLVEAVYAARAGRDDVTLIRASTKLIYVYGGLQGRFDEAHLWVGLTRADLERIGGHEELESAMLSNAGSVMLLEGRLEEALPAYERALQLTEKALGKDHPQRGIILSNLAIIHLEQKRYEKVISMEKESLELISRTRGPDHVNAAFPHEAMGRAYTGMRDFKAAHEHLGRALELYQRSLGPEHRQVSDGMDALAELLRSEGRYEEAVEQSRRALELKVKAIGPDHPDVSYSLCGLAQGYLQLKQPARALPLFERALKLRGEDPVKRAEPLFGMAQALWAMGRDRSRARAMAETAHTTYLSSGDIGEAERVAAWLEAGGARKTARR